MPRRTRGWPILGAGLVILAVAGRVPAQSATEPWDEPDAIVLGLAQPDLDRVLHAALAAHGWPVVEGTRESVSRRMSALSYRAAFTDPQCDVGEGGALEVGLRIVDADLRVGRIERSLLLPNGYCEDFGVAVRPDRPVDVTLTAHLRVEGGELGLYPDAVEVGSVENFLLRGPTRCGNMLLPRWLVWWIGKGHVRRYLREVDELLLARARAAAAALGEEGGLLGQRWSAGEGTGEGALAVRPRVVETRGDRIVVALAAGEAAAPLGAGPVPAWVEAGPQGSFLALSQSFVNRWIGAELRRAPGEPSAGGDVSRILASDAALALAPGLRALPSREALRVRLAVPAPPLVEFVPRAPNPGRERPGETATTSRASIRVTLRGVELRFFVAGDERELGVLRVDRAIVESTPYANVLGGISLALERNEWSVSSTGIAFDDALVAATLRELLFGEAFATRFEPLGRESMRLGRAALRPTGIDLQGDYLVIGFTARDAPAPPQDLRARR